MAAPMLLDWTKLWPLVLTSSVIAAFLTYGLGLLKDWFNRSRDADFAALYVALTLEDYASRCASVVGDIDTFWSSRGSAGSSHENVPELGAFGADVEWKALGVKLTSKALSFRIRIGRTRGMLTDLSQHVNEEIVEEAHDHAVKLGLDALAAADHFRKVRRLGPAPSVADWSTRDWLQEKADKIAVRKAAEKAAMADD
ncbi:hypothetical protein [Brevundimonas sp. KM4]|uniref:hypothetical protein n=1 Tax=Brevundimonas sp. KM4 TaxID=1628191 RepID=UPI000A929F05|nr:hypothetical protein [Brevundimonas sp. KM4]